MSDLVKVKAMLQALLEQAYEVEADMGEMPGADEALSSAIVKIDEMLAQSAE